MTIPSITPLPTAPDPASPATFNALATAFTQALPGLGTELNATVAQMNTDIAATNTNTTNAAASAATATTKAAEAAASAASALAAPGTSATSTTSLTIGVGTKNLTIQTGKSISVGQRMICARTSDVNKYMVGAVVSYNSGTGALVLSVASGDIGGSGTYTDWTLSVCGLTANILNAIDLTTLGPSIKPSLYHNFAATRQLPSSYTYTMTSAITYFDAAGVMQTCPAGIPCFTYDPATGESLGLLVWEQRTNSLLYSEQVDNAVYAKTRTTVTSNAISAPDGNSSADKLVEDTTATNTHHFYQLVTISAGAVYTVTYYVKAGERQYVQLSFDDGSSNGVYATFDVLNGVITAAAAARGTGTNASATIAPCSGGYYRISLTGVAGPSSTTGRVLLFLSNVAAPGFSPTYTGDGTSGLYPWGGQLEAGSSASPYIPTTSAAVTRAAPTITRPTSSDWFNASEGTIYAEARVPALSSTNSQVVADISDGTGNQRMTLRISQSSGNDSFVVFDAGVNQAAIAASLATANVSRKYAASYKANDFAFCADGGTVQTDASGTVPAVTALYLGAVGAGGSTLNGTLAAFGYFPKRVTNAEVVSASTL